jgi:hypothetical protein
MDANHKIEFSSIEKYRSVSDDGGYVAAVRAAVSEQAKFDRFKEDPRYIRILEHTSFKQGQEYFERIHLIAPDFIRNFEPFLDNDIVGGGEKYSYPLVGNCSPSTLRYVKVVADLRFHFGSNLGFRVAEIGVGYGGQLLTLDKVLSYREYHLYDLQDVLALASKYLECHLLNGSYKAKTINQFAGDIEYDVVISNYAFSELPSKVQSIYLEKIISKAKRGYLTMNSGRSDSAFVSDKMSLDELVSRIPNAKVIEENPKTHPGNYILCWGGFR